MGMDYLTRQHNLRYQQLMIMCELDRMKIEFCENMISITNLDLD